MAVPQTIDSGNRGAFQSGNVGPFVYNSKVFVVVTESADGSNPGEIAVWGADNPATESFTEEDAGNGPSTNANGDNWLAVSAEARNDVIHFVSWDQDTEILLYHSFNMASETWTVTNETILTGVAIFDGPCTIPVAGIAVRWNGEVVVHYDGDPDKVMGVERSRNEWARRNVGGTWNAGNAIGSPTNTAINWYGGVAVLGSDGERVHFFYIESDGGAGTEPLQSKTLDGNDSLSSVLTAVSDQIGVVNYRGGMGGVCYDDGTGRVLATFENVSGFDDLSVVEYDSVDSPSSPSNTATGAVAASVFSSKLASFRKTLFAVFRVGGNDDIVYRFSVDGGTWSARQTFEAGTFFSTTPLSANVIDYGDGPKLAAHYNPTSGGGTGVRYNEVDLAPAAIDWDTEGLFPEQNYALGPFGT